MKYKKIYLLIISMMVLMFTTSCKTTIINEVINRYVEYSENISILDFEDVLVEASEKASSSVIGLKYKSNSTLITSSGFGSGVIIKKEEISSNLYKYIVITNRHIVQSNNGNKRNIFVTFSDGDEYQATILDVDNEMDIAFISFESPRILSVAQISTNETNVGRFVIAIGNPYDIDTYFNTVSIGNVSYVNRIVKEQDSKGNDINNIYIQHTAPINSGNSGGGLFNIKGELIGLNTWKIANEDIEGMAFAIPIFLVYPKYQSYFE